MTAIAAQIRKEFQDRFRTEPMVIASPGRINLIGEHVDYNQGFVLPGAIDRQFVFAAALNHSDNFRIYSHDFHMMAEFSLKQLTAGSQWYNYFMGVADGFAKRGVKLSGLDCVFGGDIPSGGGMSSSAALCCGFGFALNELCQSGLDRIDLGLIAQYAEHEFAGVKCGLMDQYASLFGEHDNLLLLDCRSTTHKVIPFPSGKCTIILADTRIKHSLASTAYNDRRAACERGVTKLQSLFPKSASLRDIGIEELEEGRGLLSAEVYQRCHYVVTEMARTLQAAAALKEGNLTEVGELMFSTHEGLRLEYEVSCPELDALVNVARKHPEHVIGARMMGGGFGGCTINLVRPGAEDLFRSLVTTEYFASFKNSPEFYTVTLEQGTHRVYT